MATPTQKSLKLLRENGYLCHIVEHWNPFAKIRQDLYGFIDILAVKKKKILGVQTTSRGNVSTRAKKILGHDNYKKVKESGIEIEVHGWEKGSNKPRIVCLTGK